MAKAHIAGMVYKKSTYKGMKGRNVVSWIKRGGMGIKVAVRHMPPIHFEIGNEGLFFLHRPTHRQSFRAHLNSELDITVLLIPRAGLGLNESVPGMMLDLREDPKSLGGV